MPATPVAQPRPPNMARMLGLTLAWGSCFIAIRWGLRDAPILWFATLRALLAGGSPLVLGAIRAGPTPGRHAPGSGSGY